MQLFSNAPPRAAKAGLKGGTAVFTGGIAVRRF